MRRSLIALGLVALPLVACSGADGASPADVTQAEDLSAASTTTYVDIVDYWSTDAQQTAWFAAKSALKLQFDNICGDTFCGGDYGNLTSLELNCAVSKARGAVRTCTWVFAASYESTNATTGAVTSSVPHYLCKFNPSGTAAQLTAFFAKPGSLQTPLPGLAQSAYDVLGDCFQHPVGATAIPTPGTGPYVDAFDAPSVDQGAWYDMNAALASSFDSVCGDTFCEGDYADLASLRFACSVNVKSNQIDKCLWDFAGDYSTVSKSGTVSVNAKAFRCAIPVKGTPQQLLTVLTAAGTVDAIHRPLPGGTKSAYDALVGCL